MKRFQCHICLGLGLLAEFIRLHVVYCRRSKLIAHCIFLIAF